MKNIYEDTGFNNVTLDNGLVGYWKFDEGAGTVARDSSANGNDGTLNGSMTDEDWVDISAGTGTTNFYNPYALDFDGGDDYVDVSGSIVYADNAKPFSVSSWFVANTPINQYQTLLSLKSSESNQYQIFYSSDSNYNFTFGQGGDNGVKSSSLPSSNVWHHIVITYNGSGISSSSNYTFHVDGVSQSIENGNAVGGVTNATVIGFRSGGSSNNYWKGLIDDVRIYSRALSSSEVGALAAGNPSTGSGYYTLGASLDIAGDFKNYTANLVSSGSITMSGNWLNVGDFTHDGSGTVLFDGVNQTISGSTVFWQLQSTGSTADTLTFDYTSRQNISGSLVLQGVNSQLLTVKSSKTGSASKLLLDASAGTSILSYLDVKDSDASGGSQLLPSSSTNSLNNTNWDFGAETVTWTNGSGDNNWSTAGNWNTGNIPGTDDTALFDSTSTANSTFDTGFLTTIAGLRTENDYTGTITLAQPLGISGSMIISGGILDVSSSNYDVTVDGDWKQYSSGEFAARAGTVYLTSTGDTLTLSGSSSFSNISIDDGLVGYWKFDDGVGTLAKDSSRFGNDGTLTNMTSDDWVDISAGTGTTNFYNPYALDFDGSDDYVDMNDGGGILDGLSAVTLSAWINTNDNTAQQMIVTNASSDGADGSSLYARQANNMLRFGIDTGDVTSLDHTFTFTEGQWYYIAGTYDGNTMRSYIDGAEVNNTAKTGTLEDLNLDVITGAYNGALLRFNGLIDDVRIYSRALSSSEVASLAAGNAYTGSGVLTLGSSLDINGDLSMYTGGIDNSGNHNINLSGSWLNYGGQYIRGTETITFDGVADSADQKQIYEDTGFNNVTLVR